MAKANISKNSKWALVTGLLAGLTVSIAVLADVALIGYVGIGFMFLGFILGFIVLVDVVYAETKDRRSRNRAWLGMVFSLLPIAVGL